MRIQEIKRIGIELSRSSTWLFNYQVTRASRHRTNPWRHFTSQVSKLAIKSIVRFRGLLSFAFFFFFFWSLSSFTSFIFLLNGSLHSFIVKLPLDAFINTWKTIHRYSFRIFENYWASKLKNYSAWIIHSVVTRRWIQNSYNFFISSFVLSKNFRV